LEKLRKKLEKGVLKIENSHLNGHPEKIVTIMAKAESKKNWAFLELNKLYISIKY
jgi:hypothetical protein